MKIQRTPVLALAFAALPGTALAQTGWSLGPEVRLDVASSLSFGRPVASDGLVLAVGAPIDTVGGVQDVGAAFVLRRSAGGWSHEQVLEPWDLAGALQAQWGFGSAIDVVGDLVVVGAPLHDGVCPGQFWCNSGQVYTFERASGGWVQGALLVPAALEDNDQFGTSVAIAGDQLLISAIGDNDAGTLAGAVYVFQRTPSGWAEVQKLLPSDAQARIQFGSAIRVDGDVAVIAGVGHRQGSTLNAQRGSAYVFRRTAGVWTEEAALLPEAFHHEIRFGSAVDVSGDHVVVGAMGRHSNNTRDGAAYAFERLGGVWTRTQILTPPNALFEDRFGLAVAVHGDRLAVGKWNNSVSSPRDVQVYEHQGGQWVHAFQLTSQNPYPADFLGRSIAMTGDGMFFGWDAAAYAFDLQVQWDTFCAAAQNSTGSVGQLTSSGHATLALNDLVLTAQSLPMASFGFLLVAPAEQAASTPMGSAGALCLGGGIGRFVGPGQVQSTGTTGSFATAVDLAALPRPNGPVTAVPGETWRFQAWHRDTAGGLPTSNFTEGIAVTVQ